MPKSSSLIVEKGVWAVPPSILGSPAVGPYLAACIGRSTEPPTRTASRHMRVTVPSAVAAARSSLEPSAAHADLPWLRGRRLSLHHRRVA